LQLFFQQLMLSNQHMSESHSELKSGPWFVEDLKNK
jgi:hypothetical protein